MSTTRYQLTVEAKGIASTLLGFKKPSPYAVVTIPDGENQSELGQTEVLQRTTNADWVKTFFLDLTPNVVTPLHIVIKTEPLGRKLCETRVDDAYQVFKSEGHKQTFKIGGTEISVQVHESAQGDSTGMLNMRLRGLDIKNTEPGMFGLGRSDPFFELKRKEFDKSTGRAGGWNVVYRSKHIDDHLNPYWDEFDINLESLCFCDLTWQIQVDVLDFEDDGNHRLIGRFETTVEELMKRISIRGNADRDQAFELHKEDENGQSEEAKSGLVVVVKAEITPV